MAPRLMNNRTPMDFHGALGALRAVIKERPDAILVTVTDSSGQQRVTAFTLKDQAGAQQITVTGTNVVSVRVTIQSVYGSAPGRLVGVAELEFFGRN